MEDKRKLNIPLIILGVILYAAGFTAAAFYDLAIDKALFNPSFFPAIFMECCGYYVIYLPPICLCALTASDAKRSIWQRLIGGILSVGGIVGLNIYTIYGMDKRNVNYSEYISLVVWLAIILILGCIFYNKRSAVFYKKAYFVLLWGTAYFALELAVINIFKTIWNRTRFDDMLAAGSLDKFTPWYHPFGNGGTSFPSGHTASACGIFILIILIDVMPKLKKYRSLIFAGCFVYVGLMAVSRLIMGRHFLSDTLSASGIMIIVFMIMTRTKIYRKTLHTALVDVPKEQSK